LINTKGVNDAPVKVPGLVIIFVSMRRNHVPGIEKEHESTNYLYPSL
jgi:hypothetical protein